MCSDVVISVEHLSKCYHIFDKPHERLLQMISMGRKRYYREFWALDDISFQVKRGETVGIIGRNGSGKSTLLQMICGTLNPTSGKVQTNGRVAALLELGSGFNPEFTGRENVYMNASVLGLTLEEIDERFEKIVIFSEIGEFIEQPVKTYSSGMMLRLAFAVIAHVEADLLIIDEALAVGDAYFTQKCMRFLRGFMQKGSILLVSHDMSAIKGLCSRCVWLDKGIGKMIGSSKEVAEKYLEDIYRQEHSIKNNSNPAVPVMIDVNYFDQRAQFINGSNLRNDLRVFYFQEDYKSFGKGGAKIQVATLSDQGQRILSWIVGGEVVILHLVIEVYESLDSPIVGFSLNDRLGQPLFGDNTYLAFLNKPKRVVAGDRLSVKFVFRMPILPIGEYSINMAIADGSQNEHVQHHWIHDAIIIRSESTSVSTGLVGIPMMEIQMEVL